MSAPEPFGLRSLPKWDLFYAFTLLATATIVLTSGADPLGRDLTSCGLLLFAAVWYWIFGRSLAAAGTAAGRRRAVFVAVLLALFVSAMVIDGPAAWYSPAVIAQLFWTLPMTFAVPTVVLIAFTPTAISAMEAPDRIEALRQAVPAGLIFCGLSLLIGHFISRMATQSEAQAELIERLEASRAEVAQLSHAAGTSAERERLAREIHDTLAQGFTSIVTLVQAVESEWDSAPPAARRHLELALRTARENLAEARAMVAALSPSALDDGSLEDAVRRQAERLGEVTPIRVVCEIQPFETRPSTAASVVLLRGAQEALHNVRRHSGATVVIVLLSVAEDFVRLSVRDNGTGFDQQHVSGGYGIAGMRARAEQVGGRLEIHSGKSGTMVELEVPL
ncbi:Signal transduction histidine kinase [Amycolatopsis marina]|uniref:histidine kinase n=1 Tax=Amycolatopsis marina TaxID=490629 RepID=A0A1I1CNF1_9PSEU|nr:sensor histidine kinase [Amycolatopsis marina]SFB62150.1 Signal transduction histidine kinase [Amycolatopsis marina]